MRYDPNKHRRGSIRLKGFDYSQPGAYFVTICTYQRESMLGEIINWVMILNACSRIVQHAWDDLPNHYAHVLLDEFCVMPNHVHGIIVLTEDMIDGGSGRGGSQTHPYQTHRTQHHRTQHHRTQHQPKRHGLPEIVRAFKSFSSRRVNQLLDSEGTPFWQRNYYEHIVRSHRLTSLELLQRPAG